MSAEASAAYPPFHNHGLRLTIACVSAAVMAMAINNLLAAIVAPIFVAALLAPGAPAPPVRMFVLPAIIWVVGFLVDTATIFLGDNKDVLLAFYAWVIFLCFWDDTKAGPKPATGLILIVLVMVGTLSSASPVSTSALVDALALAAALALVAIIIAHGLAPGGLMEKDVVAAKPSSHPLRESLGRTALLMVLVSFYIMTEITGGLYVLVAAATILRLPAASRGALGLVAANIVGGAVALSAALFMAVTPSTMFDVVLFAAMVLGLGLAAEAGGKLGNLAKGATGVTIILLTIALISNDETGAYFTRVFEITLSVTYVLLGRAVLDPPDPIENTSSA
ncbi:MAG: hypothetical protein P8Q36_01095 [Alphaproteobacteria bacterium]|jgi:hypothetical protein|nr:hypothetical protein [Rhodospirillaceae bacterium]MBT6508989.1 hypothetical protein [Rhodospirillaceae bacterium]MBT7646123.1 hypothetical protein [Rhodospirillaceae bacterium]MDG2479452.1 hypothetical protein [Alphaproteobacteria bacterium]